MQQRTRRLMAAGILATVCLGTTSAVAGTSFREYSTTVGKFNGKGYTSYQTKSYSDKAGDLRSSSVGGNYKVDARMIPEGVGISGVTDNSEYKLNTNLDSGKSARVELNNGVFTRVDVQVSGTWRSN